MRKEKLLFFFFFTFQSFETKSYGVDLFRAIVYYIIGKAYQSQWYSGPIQLQNYYLLIIRQSQVTVNFSGLGAIDCNMELFEKVIICT